MSDAAYEKGYYEQGEWLDGKSLAEAEHALAERKPTGNSYNNGATAATEDYIIRLRAQGGTP